MCYNLGKVSDSRARRVAIETNETRFESDNLKLAGLIQEIGVSEGAEFTLPDLALSMPYSEQQMRDMVDLLNFDWEKYSPENMPEGEKGKPKEKGTATCPECGHKFKVKS